MASISDPAPLSAAGNQVAPSQKPIVVFMLEVPLTAPNRRPVHERYFEDRSKGFIELGF